MRRRHTREDYLGLVGALRDAVPGHRALDRRHRRLPGGDGRDFEETLSLTRAVRFHSMFSFKYSPRPGTLAAERLPDDVSDGEKRERIVALQARSGHPDRRCTSSSSGRPSRCSSTRVSRRRDRDVSGRTSRQYGRELSRARRSAGRERRPVGRARRQVASAGGPAQPGRRAGSGDRGARGGHMLIEMTIKGLMVDPVTNMPIVILKDKRR